MAINAFVVLAGIVFFGWRGYRRGVIRTLQRLISIMSGYVACYLFSGAFAGFLKTTFTLNIFLCYLASTILVLLGGVLVADFCVSRLMARAEVEQNDDEEDADTQPRHKAGMAVGVLLGCFLGLFTVWLVGISMDAIMLRTQAQVVLAARTADPVRKVAGAMVGGAVGYVVEQKTGHDSLAPDLVANLVANPLAMSQQIAEVSKSEEIKQFFSNPSIQLLMQDNKIDELQRHDAFLKLMNTPQTKVFFGVLGTSVEKGSVMTQESRAAHLLTDMYQKARRVQTDPRFIALAEKPEFQQMLQNPSPASILTNPLLKELGDIIFSTSPSVVSVGPAGHIREGSEQSFQSVQKPQWEKLDTTLDPPPAVSPDDGQVPEEETKVIYRWTDERGQKHFSQSRPAGDYPLEIIKTEP